MYNLDMAKEWMKASVIDLNVIKEIVNNENLTTMTAFHSQQSIEKSLKALLEYHNQDIPKIHQIKKLFRLSDKYINIDLEIEMVLNFDSGIVKTIEWYLKKYKV